MVFLNTRELQTRGKDLAAGFRRETRVLVLVYCGVIAALSLGSNGLNLFLESQIGQTGGLGGLGMRSVLQTIQTVLSYVNMFFGPFWSAGFLLAMLGMVRGGAPRLGDLTGGFRRFTRILGGLFFEFMTCFLLMLASANLAAVLFTMSPLGVRFEQLMGPVLADPNLITPEGAVNLELLPAEAMAAAMIPMVILTLVVFVPCYIWLSYGFRMSGYLLVERPIGGFRAHFESMRLMRGHKMQIFRLDLRFWWYHALTVLAAGVGSLDAILGALGIGGSINKTVLLFGSLILYFVLLTALYLWKKCDVDAAYVLAYEAIAYPEQTE